MGYVTGIAVNGERLKFERWVYDTWMRGDLLDAALVDSLRRCVEFRGVTSRAIKSRRGRTAFVEMGPYDEAAQCYALEGDFPVVELPDGRIVVVLEGVEADDLPEG